MNLDIKLGAVFSTTEGDDLVCYDTSERFAYLCPFSTKGEDTVVLNISKTRVYSLECGDTPVEAIETMEVLSLS